MKKSTYKYIHGTAPSEQERLRRLNALTNAAFVDFLALSGGESVLDVGSGLGLLACDIAARLPRGRVVGVEFSDAQLHSAPAEAPANVAFLRGDAHALPIAAGSMDVAYCRYLLEHVADPVRVLSEMRRVLKSGGRAAMQENNILVTEFHPDCPAFQSVWKHFAELQRQLGGDALVGKKLYAHLRSAGFTDIRLSIQPEVHHAGMPTFVPWVDNLVNNILPARDKLEASGLASREEVDAGVAELRALMASDDGTALFYWNRAMAVK